MNSNKKISNLFFNYFIFALHAANKRGKCHQRRVYFIFLFIVVDYLGEYLKILYFKEVRVQDFANLICEYAIKGDKF